MNSNTILDILLIQSFDLDYLIEEYRLFFLSIIPSMFIMVCLVEYFDRLDWSGAFKRALISILILSSVSTFYKSSILASIEAASMKLQSLKQSNILLMDMFEGGKYLDKLGSQDNSKFYKEENIVGGTLKFLKYHLFDSFVNDGFTISVFFITKLCFLIIKVVYSMVFYLGIGLIGIPCLLFLFPTMGNVLRGAILSYVWCLVVPHILVFVLSLIGSEINKGYITGQIIGGSATGTALLFIMALFVAFTPLVGMMLLNGSGVAHAGGVIASIGANYVMNLPKTSVNNLAQLMTGGNIGPKLKLSKAGAQFSYNMTKSTLSKFNKSKSQENAFNQKMNTSSIGKSSSSEIQFMDKNGFYRSSSGQMMQKSTNANNQRRSLNQSRSYNLNRSSTNRSSRNQNLKKENNTNAKLSKYNSSNRVAKKAPNRF